MIIKSLMKQINLIYLLMFVLMASFECSSQQQQQQQQPKKKHNLNRVAKSNKTNKRQESTPPRPSDPEFDQLANVEKPRPIAMNITAIIGHNAYLPCAVRNIGSYKILWLRVKDGDVLAYDNMLITQDSRFSLIKNFPNESNLLVQNVELKDSGEYACQINTQPLKAKLVNLMILTPPTFADAKLELTKEYSTQLALASPLISNDAHQQQQQQQQQQKKNLNNEHSSNDYSPQHSADHSSTKSIDVHEGEQIPLECSAVGYPTPTINWYVKRLGNENLTEYSLNSSKIVVKNVLRNQYEYFECEATNRVPPSISKKFKINVKYVPEVNVSPSKVFINSPPAQVRFSCLVSSYPESEIIWIYSSHAKEPAHNSNAKRQRQVILSKVSHKHFKHHRNIRRQQQQPADNEEAHEFILENNLSHNSNEKYQIFLQSFNETFKQSSIVINVENENDYGAYLCYANNSIGSKSVKFFIYGDNLKKHTAHSVSTSTPEQSTTLTTSEETLSKKASGQKLVTKSIVREAATLSNRSNYVDMFSLNTNSEDELMIGEKELIEEKVEPRIRPSSTLKSFVHRPSTLPQQQQLTSLPFLLNKKTELSLFDSIFGSQKSFSLSKFSMCNCFLLLFLNFLSILAKNTFFFLF